MFENAIKLGSKGQICLLLSISIALLSRYPLLTTAAAIFPFIAAKLLWRQNEPPILFIAYLFQWLQVTIKVFYSDFYSLSLEMAYTFPKHILEAYCLSFVGLLVQCLGINLIIQKVPVRDKEYYLKKTQAYSLKKVTITYLLAVALYPLLVQFSFMLGGLQQFVQKIADMKWSIFFLLYVVTFLKNNRKHVLYLIILCEIVLSFSGYFGSFKDYFLVFAISYLMLSPKFEIKQYLLFGSLGVVLIYLGIVWQYIKPEYRNFLSSGEASQSVVVSKREALTKFVELIRGMDNEAYQEGVVRLVDRITYIDYFSASIDYVPKQVPFEQGKLWAEALGRVFLPRFIFPNKSIIDDSERTRKYTGLEMAGKEEGTSITLGYMGESYVDFGPIYMFIPLFLFGLIIGSIYKYIISTSRNIIWGIAFLFPLFFQIQIFEISLDKLLGGVIAYFLVLLFIRRFAIPQLDKLLQETNRSFT